MSHACPWRKGVGGRLFQYIGSYDDYVTYDMSDGTQTAKLAVGCLLDGGIRRHSSLTFRSLKLRQLCGDYSRSGDCLVEQILGLIDRIEGVWVLRWIAKVNTHSVQMVQEFV